MTIASGALVLVATTDKTLASALRCELESLRCKVVVVGGVIDAIAELHGSEFDLAFVAHALPPRTGADVVRVAHELSPETEVVVVLDAGREDAPVEYVRLGAFDFLHQPLRPTELNTVVDRALERRHARASNAMFRASHAILAGTKPDQLQRVIVELAADVLAADGVAFLRSTGERLEPTECHGFKRKVTPEDLGRVVEKVRWTAGAPILLPEDLGPAAGNVFERTHIRTAVAVPIMIDGRLAGVLAASRSADPRPFRRGDAERMGIFASQLRLSIENARLIEKTVATERLAAIGELAAGVAHEIASPLTYVLGNAISAAEEIRRPCIDVEDMSAMLADIKEGAERIRDIARDLRTLSRGATTTETFDLCESVRSALRVAGCIVRCSLKVSTSLETAPAICGSPGRISQVFINLLVNAAQAAKTTGHLVKLELVVKSEGDTVVAIVRDEGPGIPPAILARIFDPFFTTKSSQNGTGLGLSITRSILQDHGGSIEVTSEVGAGATFIIRLPAAHARLRALNSAA